MPLLKFNANHLVAHVPNIVTRLPIVGAILTLYWILTYTHYGIDFTDEAFYLIWIANPFIYDYSLSQFGYIYHPLHVIFNGDIAALRKINILLTFGLTWGLVFFILRSTIGQEKTKKIDSVCIAAGVSTCSLIYFDYWLPTPSYNSLTLQALLITSIGLIQANKSTSIESIIGWLTIGLGGWLTFMAKPSSALLLAAVAITYLKASGKLSISMLPLAICTALALLWGSAILIDGSMAKFGERLLTGIEFAQYLGGGHTVSSIFRLDNLTVTKKLDSAIFIIFLASLIGTWGALSYARIGFFISCSISILFFSLTILISLETFQENFEVSQNQELVLWGVLFSALLTSIIYKRGHALKTSTPLQWSSLLLFCAMPYVYAFGTTNNYWQIGGYVAIFWVIAGLTMLAPIAQKKGGWSFIAPMVLISQAVTAALLQTGFEQPYRQPQPLKLNTHTTMFGPYQSPLILSSDYQQYIADAKNISTSAGLTQDTPIIDLSGHSPGILYALAAKSIGQAWTIGGYPGSRKLAIASLHRTSCKQIARAWILQEPDGPRSIPTDTLSALGANFPQDYELRGTWQTPAGAGGLTKRRTQLIYAPNNLSKTLRNCEAIREQELQ